MAKEIPEGKVLVTRNSSQQELEGMPSSVDVERKRLEDELNDAVYDLQQAELALRSARAEEKRARARYAQRIRK